MPSRISQAAILVGEVTTGRPEALPHPLTDIANRALIDHLLDRLGEDGVALGSDFDGALMPSDLPDAAALPGFLDAMAAHGYGAELIEKIAWKNWMSVLSRTWDR